ncbi:metal-dependent hydrolase [Saccharopolyspora subtropica]|uniref:Endonuclease/exonuclease/phosphatase family protein n=1 Tax=Saccharopolyspora thermophila TaxID=89367 RepID=A0A917JUB6_9PSEU|nr:metal-dependent hydrolase [Saccharopolyspora subtropica]
MLASLLPGSAHADPGHRFSALTFNIHAGIGVDGQLDLARTAAAITASGADVVGLQEVDVHWSARSRYADQVAELARRTGMHTFFAPIYDLDPEPGRIERRRYGVAVLSRFPMIRTENHLLTRLSTVEENPVPRPMPGFAEAVVAVPGGPVHVYVTHLDYRPDPAVRRIQVAETIDVLDQDRAGARQLLLGDFNAEPDAPELARVRDGWSAANGPQGGHTYPAPEPVKRIDYVTCSDALRPTRAAVLDSPASDHLPVLVVVTTQPA